MRYPYLVFKIFGGTTDKFNRYKDQGKKLLAAPLALVHGTLVCCGTLVGNHCYVNSIDCFTNSNNINLLNGDSVLVSSQFTLLPRLPVITMLDLKVVKIDIKIMISLR